jgi:hypothetical protein
LRRYAAELRAQLLEAKGVNQAKALLAAGGVSLGGGGGGVGGLSVDAGGAAPAEL